MEYYSYDKYADRILMNCESLRRERGGTRICHMVSIYENSSDHYFLLLRRGVEQVVYLHPSSLGETVNSG